MYNLKKGISMKYFTEKVANALYNSGCIKFGSFKIKSGAQSPYYIDMARLLSNPKELCNIVDASTEKILEITAANPIDKLASIELKGALIAPSIACRLNMPCIIVRKEEKAYGFKGRIAGADVLAGDRVLFFDDVVSEGLSKIEGVKPLQELGATVQDLLVVVNREQGGKETLEKLGFHVHALSRISEIVNSLRNLEKISDLQEEAVLDYVRKLEATNQ